jgi:putative flippase GtrA
MWVVLVAAAFVAVILGHAVVSRLTTVRLNMVARFVVVGAPVGLVLLLVLVWRGSPWIELIAGLLAYALICELYIFVFTMISSSVSVSLLLKLRHGAADWRQLDAEYSDAVMVEGRLGKLLANGMIAPVPDGYAVTPRGEALVASFDRLQRFFRHTRAPRGGSGRLAEIGRWWVVGLAFLVINIPLLYVLHDVLGLAVWLATLTGGELGTLARFLVNDRWVFGHRHPTLQRTLQYHVAVASSFCIWWAVTNGLAQIGLHYLLASIVGQAASVGWSMLTNFGWIWRRRARATADVPVAVGADGTGGR